MKEAAAYAGLLRADDVRKREAAFSGLGKRMVRLGEKVDVYRLEDGTRFGEDE